MEFRPESSPLVRLTLLGLGLCAAIAALFVSQFHEVLIHHARCPFLATTGIPCPTCGGTHSIVAMVQGHLLGALASNPGITIVALMFLVAVLWASGAMIIPSWRLKVVLSQRDKHAVMWLAALLLFGSWLYEIWRLV